MRTPAKLEADLVPTNTWGKNLRAVLPAAGWDRLRRWAYERAGHRCEICGATGKDQGRKHDVEAHEVWEYDDVTQTQTLVGVQALCPRTHMVKHYGRSMKVGAAHVVRQHLAEVNGWSATTIAIYEDYIFDVHAHRSRFRWTVNMLDFLRDMHAQGVINDRDLKVAKENLRGKK